MYTRSDIEIRKATNDELREFCDLVGLVVLNAVEDGPEATGDITFIARMTDGVPVGCCRIDRFSESGDLCMLNYYLCDQFKYAEDVFAEMLFSVLRQVYAEFGVNRVACAPVKKMYPRQRFFPESGFVVEVLFGCVNPNGEYLVEQEYVLYREEFEKRYGNR